MLHVLLYKHLKHAPGFPTPSGADPSILLAHNASNFRCQVKNRKQKTTTTTTKKHNKHTDGDLDCCMFAGELFISSRVYRAHILHRAHKFLRSAYNCWLNYLSDKTYPVHLPVLMHVRKGDGAVCQTCLHPEACSDLESDLLAPFPALLQGFVLSFKKIGSDPSENKSSPFRFPFCTPQKGHLPHKEPSDQVYEEQSKPNLTFKAGLLNMTSLRSNTRVNGLAGLFCESLQVGHPLLLAGDFQKTSKRHSAALSTHISDSSVDSEITVRNVCTQKRTMQLLFLQKQFQRAACRKSRKENCTWGEIFC